jgi:hypothetical protein
MAIIRITTAPCTQVPYLPMKAHVSSNLVAKLQQSEALHEETPPSETPIKGS